MRETGRYVFMLNIRRFTQGADEPAWVKVLNASRKGREDWRTATAEEMLLQEKERPGFDLEGRFIAELDGTPVGAVHANVEQHREERKGFIRFYVVPESRGMGIERKLIKLALRELKARRMTTAQASIDYREKDYVALLEGLGFQQVRVGSMMEMDLANVPQGIGEKEQITIRTLEKNREEDIKLVTSLLNEAFKEHFDFRPDTVEEIRYFLFSDLFYKKGREIFFAILGNETVGCIGAGIDEKRDRDSDADVGDIFTIGVLKRYRRRGIGARLMLHALREFKTKGVTKVTLGVDDYNPTKAIELYKKVGFRVKKKDLVFAREL
jgi:mycothiol synthase